MSLVFLIRHIFLEDWTLWNLASKLVNLGMTKKIQQARTRLKRAPSIPLKFTKMWWKLIPFLALPDRRAHTLCLHNACLYHQRPLILLQSFLITLTSPNLRLFKTKKMYCWTSSHSWKNTTPARWTHKKEEDTSKENTPSKETVEVWIWWIAWKINSKTIS